MELNELLDRCLYEDELKEILVTFGEEPEGMKVDLIDKLMRSNHKTAELIRLIDEDMLTIVCLESGVPTSIDREEMVDVILEDILGEKHDYIEVQPNGYGIESDAQEDPPPLEEPPEVELDDVVEMIGSWAPINCYLPRAVISGVLVEYLRNKGQPVQEAKGNRIMVGRNVTIQLARGREERDIEDLIERMLLDLEEIGAVIGVMYGVENDSFVDQLEESLDGVFTDTDKIAIILI